MRDRMLIRCALVLCLAAIAMTPALAHEVRPAFLQIREIEPSMYDVLWKTPAQGDMRLALNVVLPEQCESHDVPRVTVVNAAVVEHWRSRCEGGIAGKKISFENLATTLTDVIVRFEPIAGSPKTLRVNGAAPAVEMPTQQTTSEVAGMYFLLGVEHILFGFDHLLFVLCMLMLTAERKALLLAITAFTLAHSITLAGTTFGWLRLASAPVEACIALSIAFLAAEIIKTRSGRVRSSQQWLWVAAFGFGLLHGFGFAAALHDIGLPESAVPLALLSFNLGVEAGQILFVAVVLAMMFLGRRWISRPPLWAWRAPPYIAGIVASFWFIERTVRIVF